MSRLPISVVCAVFIVLLLGCSSDKGTGPDGVNHPPVITEMRDTTAVVGDTLEVAIEASDLDGDDLEFTLTYQCQWSDIVQDRCPIAGIHTAGPVFWLWPRANDVSVPGFTITVSDGRGGSDATSLRVNIITS